MANKFSGSALYFQWVYSGGTVLLSGQQRSVTITPSVDLIDGTAGDDADKEYLSGVKDATVSFAGVMSAMADSPTYAEMEAALVEGNAGTINLGPEGTASTKRKYIIPAISLGASIAIPYDDVVELSNEFQKNGAMTRTTWGA